MFTGIVQDIGTIDKISRVRGALRLRIQSSFDQDTIREGDSINVNGACLTAEMISANFFEVYVSRETLMRTNFSFLREREEVNLERSMEVGDRFGGHIVQGHIDAVGTVKKIVQRDSETVVRVSWPANLEGLFVEKGSVSINGVSLTISGIGRNWIDVTLVPYTLKRTNLSTLRVGHRVNIETDIVGKYVQKYQEMGQRWRKKK